MKELIFVIIVFVIIGSIIDNLKKKQTRKSTQENPEDDNVIFMDPNKKKKRSVQFPSINKKILVWVMIVVIIVAALTTCFYTVDQTEYAFITTFGTPNEDIAESGLRFKLPYPIQKVHRLSKETFSLTLGYEENSNQVHPESNEMSKEAVYESKMITGDENIILADLEVQWKIVDPIAYTYNVSNPKELLLNATSSALRTVIGSSLVDDALTDGRTKIINDIREKLIELSEEYDMGIAIVNVNLQDVDLPTRDVDAAFKAVTDAREERITKINEANKYRNEKLNNLKGQIDAIMSEAQANKIAAIEKAKGDVAGFNALYSEYSKAPEITKQRLSIQTLQQVFRVAKIMIVDDSGNTVKYIPIENLLKGGQP